ncbi:MAG TPA: hypothetical protein VGF73_02345 [Chthoniobacterales bacterium]
MRSGSPLQYRDANRIGRTWQPNDTKPGAAPVAVRRWRQLP